MKKFYTLIFAVLSSAVALAQPTMNAGNFNPVIGDQMIVHQHNITSLSPGPAGANQTWNFAGTTSAGSSTMVFVAPSSTGQGSNFPQANLAADIAGNYDFSNANSTFFAREGVYTTTGVLMDFPDDYKYITYPFTFNSTFTDSYQSNFVSGVPVTRTGTITTTADAWGTLILPWGTVTNVLRMHMVESYTDDFGFGTMSATSEGYFWIKPGTHYWLYSQQVTDYNAQLTYAGSYLDVASVGINDIKLDAMGVTTYPNPAVENVNISFVMPGAAAVEYVVSNAIGQEVYRSEAEELTAGPASKRIDVSNLNEGIYFLTIHINGQHLTRKFVVNR